MWVKFKHKWWVRFNYKSTLVKFHVEASKKNILIESSEEKLEVDGTKWVVDRKGPECTVKGYSNIFLKEAYQLVAYHYTMRYKEQVFVRAIPKIFEDKFLKDFNRQTQEFLNAPKPEETLENLMMAIDGDKSPLSYLQAVMVLHELWEYGINWGEETMLPIDSKDSKAAYTYEWVMRQEEPEIIHPHFYYDENQNPVIIFYTINHMEEITLNEYKHIFSRENYSVKVERTIIATAGIGSIF